MWDDLDLSEGDSMSSKETKITRSINDVADLKYKSFTIFIQNYSAESFGTY